MCEALPDTCEAAAALCPILYLSAAGLPHPNARQGSNMQKQRAVEHRQVLPKQRGELGAGDQVLSAQDAARHDVKLHHLTTQPVLVLNGCKRLQKECRRAPPRIGQSFLHGGKRKSIPTGLHVREHRKLAQAKPPRLLDERRRAENGGERLLQGSQHGVQRLVGVSEHGGRGCAAVHGCAQIGRLFAQPGVRRGTVQARTTSY